MPNNTKDISTSSILLNKESNVTNDNTSTAGILPKKYPCPRCQKMALWQGNSFKPFCSERCKIIDLGSWANEDYKIASAEDPFSTDLD